MTVQMRLCRRHGGQWRGYKYNRWSDTGTRCLMCEWQRRERKNLEWGGVTMPDWEYPCMEDAEIAMERVQAAFPHAKLRVVNVVRVTEQKEEAT